MGCGVPGGFGRYLWMPHLWNLWIYQPCHLSGVVIDRPETSRNCSTVYRWFDCAGQPNCGRKGYYRGSSRRCCCQETRTNGINWDKLYGTDISWHWQCHLSNRKCGALLYIFRRSNTHSSKHFTGRPRIAQSCKYLVFMCYSCAIHVLFMCYSCAIHVLFMCYSCAIHVLFMCYSCAIHVLFMCYSCAIHVLFMCYSCAIHVLFYIATGAEGDTYNHVYISWTMKNYSVAPQTKDHFVLFVAKESPSAVACPEWSCTRGARQGIAGWSSGVGRVMLPFPEKRNKRGKRSCKNQKKFCV